MGFQIVLVLFQSTQKGKSNSLLFLVDLAGSEKVAKTGATGDRQDKCYKILQQSRQKIKIFPPELKMGSINKRQFVNSIALAFATYLLCGPPKTKNVCIYVYITCLVYFNNLNTMSSASVKTRLRLK